MKKFHICEAEGKTSTILEAETVRCSICDEVSAKSVVRVSDSGYEVHKNYLRDSATPVQEIDDSITPSDQGCSNMRLSKCEASTLRSKVFAGGDHCHCSKCFCAIPKSRSLSTMVAPDNPIFGRYFLTGEKGKVVHKKTTETTIKYRNVNYRESDSLLSYSGANDKETMNHDYEKLVNVIHRPITCPITECHKMIARASVLQHFFFDHSKIPRIALSVLELKRVFINTSTITKQIRCFAVFLIQNDAPLVHTTNSDALMNGYKNASFLLMGVRMQSAETIKKRKEYVSIRHVRTQTEAQAESSKAKSNKDVGAAEKYIVHQHDAIILWMCRLNDNTRDFYYNISIRSPDNKLGFSFTGSPLNIGDFHNFQELYDQVECLRVIEKASYKLINEQNEFEITVNILN